MPDEEVVAEPEVEDQVEAAEDTQIESSIDMQVLSDSEAAAEPKDVNKHEEGTEAQKQVESGDQSLSYPNSEETFIGFTTHLSDTTGLKDGNENRIKPKNE